MEDGSGAETCSSDETGQLINVYRAPECNNQVIIL